MLAEPCGSPAVVDRRLGGRVALALSGVLIAATNDPWRPKAAARAAAQDATENMLPPDTPVTVENAWSA